MVIELKKLKALSEARGNSSQEAKTVDKILSSAESKLPRSCRYKSYGQADDVKTVDWVTQESTDEEGKQAAEIIAGLIRDAGVHGWEVRVTIRDDYRGTNTKWQGKATS